MERSQPLHTAPSVLSGRRVLITGLDYWPDEFGIAVYTTGLAEYLAARGADVTVIAGPPHLPHWVVPPRYQGALWQEEHRNGVRIRRAWVYLSPRQSAARRAMLEASFTALGAPALLAGIPRPDVILGVVPPLGGGALAALAAHRFRRPYALWFKDLSAPAASQSGMPGGARVAGTTRAIEGWLARHAAAVGVLTEGFRPYMESLGVLPGRVVHLSDWSHVQPPTRNRAEVRAAHGWGDHEFIVLHAGNMGLKQGLACVVDAARLAPERMPHLRMVLMGGGSQRPLLEQSATGLEHVTFLDPVAADQLTDTLTAADALLVNERLSVSEMSLPSKLTSYFAAGQPVLGAVPAEGTTAREIRRSGAGLVVAAEDPAALVAGALRLAEDAPTRHRMQAAGPAYAQAHLSADAALARIERFLARVARLR